MSWDLFPLLPGDNGITSTANAIQRAVLWSIRNAPEIRQQAEQIVLGLPERDEAYETQAVYEWVLKHYRYLKDPPGLELVKSPEVSLKEVRTFGVFQGDCDDVTAFIAALLMSIGYRVRSTVISVTGKGTAFRHIYPEVYLTKKASWLPLEACARRRPLGWSATAERSRSYLI
jgi:hypothetical protein